ncbi:MAG: hypothetical protein AMXMBFR4_09310 [Candidatus Hydrogenedentota bacterium]
MESQLLPILVVASSFASGVFIFLLREDQKALRTAANLASALLKIAFLAFMLVRVAGGITYRVEFRLLEGASLALHADPFSLLFASLSAFLWLFTTIYAIGYLEGSPERRRFFGFFSLCVCATTGIALAANLLTFLIFYELLTLTTYPLVVHRGTEKAVKAGYQYLVYTLAAGAVLLVAIVWLGLVVGATNFKQGGLLSEADPRFAVQYRVIFAMLIAGFGVKCALVPLHGWLPSAMVAPAPVSALLHAVAVVKAGAFGIVRTVYDVYGINYCHELGLLQPLAIAASITILYGSLRAVFQDDIKRRLAYSTVSQVSYIVLGAAVFGPLSTIGGIVHIVHQALMKITLFFSAGILAETLGIHKVKELDGVGKRMPWTMAAFTVAAMGMIGLPPMAGFISKWYLARGAVAAGQNWVIGVLIGSTVLNAMYFLPLVYAAWFKSAPQAWPVRKPGKWFEAPLSLLAPPLVTASLTLLVGLMASTPFSPLEWARFIMELEYLR